MFSETPLEGLLIYTPQIFSDIRGFFTESFNKKRFEERGITNTWVQDNFSVSKKNVLRGMHFQRPPYEQAKLISVIKGAAYDVVVDLRPHSKTFGQWYGIELNEHDLKFVYIPRGFAHGFLSLSDNTCFCYKVDNFYDRLSESGIHYADPEISIRWPLETDRMILSEKDQQLPLFATLKSDIARLTK